MILLGYVEHKFPNKSLFIDPDFNSLDTQTNIYSNSIGKIKNVLSLWNKNYNLSNTWPKIKKKTITQEKT